MCEEALDLLEGYRLRILHSIEIAFVLNCCWIFGILEGYLESHQLPILYGVENAIVATILSQLSLDYFHPDVM